MKTQKSDNRFLILVILITAVLLCGLSSQALATKPDNPGGGGGGGGGGKKQEIPVSVKFDDLDTDGVKSDGNGPYVKEKKVKVFIGLGGQLRLSMWDSRRRSLHLDFTGAFEDVCLPDFDDSTFADLDRVGMATLGEDEDGDGMLTPAQLDPGSQGDRFDLTGMTPESSARIGLRILFLDFNGTVWVLQFGDLEGLTGLVSVTGGSDLDGDGFSDSWDIVADPADPLDPLGPLPAALFLGASGIGTPCNFASMPFVVTVVKL
ncbi:MAG: hypothetical protein IH892_20025 [Planctomycetes bacterium]|nr:hypothetical protein [Planctomycetota bacterium]